jgi:hypothetical protein
MQSLSVDAQMYRDQKRGDEERDDQDLGRRCLNLLTRHEQDVLTVAGTGDVLAMGAAVPAAAVVLNVTVTNTTAASSLTVWPDGEAIDLYNAFGMTDVIVDVVAGPASDAI